ncbi:oligosaccharide flippase family protein [Candidatus Woesearchaeota archaeon]|nr:oligosaccharide flippase family protein [Candidatus Woesearchaeota archaeon]MBT7556909.1 oligosaccharide flippase family protein [Candidatus Woesearchaeota archaeon]
MYSTKYLKDLGLFGRVQFLAKDSILYGVASAVHKIFAIITLPVLTRYFSVEEYGVIDLYVLISGLLVTVFVFGQDSAVARFFYENENENERKSMISRSLLYQALLLLLFLPILWNYSDYFANQIHGSSHSSDIFRLVIIQLPFMLLVNFSQNLLKWTFERKQFLIITLGFVVFNMTLLVLGVTLYEINIVDVFMISLVTYIVFGLLGLFFVGSWLIVPKGLGNLNEVILLALPFGIVSTLEILTPTMTRWMVNDVLGGENLGIFAVGARLASVVSLYVSSFQTAWGPFSLSIYKEKKAINTYNLVLKIFVFIACIFVLILTFFSDWLVVLITSEHYISASFLFFPLAIGLVIQASGWITEIGISISKKSYLAIYGFFLFILVTLGITYFLSPIYGIYIVSIGLMFGYIIKAIVNSWFAQRAYSMNWEYKNILLFFLYILMFGFFASWVKQELDSNIAYLYFVNFLVILACLWIGWSLLLSRSEHIKIKEWIVSKGLNN